LSNGFREERIYPVRNDASLFCRGLDFRIISAGFIAPLEFLTGFTSQREKYIITERAKTMALRLLLTGIFFLGLFLMCSYLFSGEVYRWIDEKGTTHFTDDVSKIPEKFQREAEGLDVTGERGGGDREIKESGKSGEKLDRVRNYLEKMDRKIEAKRRIEKKISDLEDEMKLSEERLKWIEDYEKENYLYYIPYRDRKTGRLVPVASPYYDEKVRLKKRIESIQSEIKALREKVSDFLKSLQ
jgi:hypothetical protein